MFSETKTPFDNKKPLERVGQLSTSSAARCQYLKSCFKHNATYVTAKIKAVSKEDQVLSDARNNFPLAIQERTRNVIGLDHVKRQLSSYFNMFRLNSIRSHYGLAGRALNANMVFTGNPGTGKTSIARIVGAMLKDAGILQSGHVIETSPSDMFKDSAVGAEIKAMQQRIAQASGGVLFIDEAHNFPEHTAHKNDFWKNAVTVLMQAMTSPNPQGFVVVLAGYEDGINDMFLQEPGFKSRFQTFVHFNDYTPEELVAIFEKQAHNAQYILAASCRDVMLKAIKEFPQRLAKNFGNARFIHNVFEETLKCMADRMLNLSFPTQADVSTITAFDIKAALGKIQKTR